MVKRVTRLDKVRSDIQGVICIGITEVMRTTKDLNISSLSIISDWTPIKFCFGSKHLAIIPEKEE